MAAAYCHFLRNRFTMKVFKFGGASVNSVERIVKLGDILKKFPKVKVLHMSGYTEEAVKRHGHLSEDSAFLTKPVTLKTILAKIHELLR